MDPRVKVRTLASIRVSHHTSNTLSTWYYRTFILRYCWLGRTEGSKDGFLAFDMMQEHNIRDIKVRLSVSCSYCRLNTLPLLAATLRGTRTVFFVGLHQAYIGIHSYSAKGEGARRSSFQSFSQG